MEDAVYSAKSLGIMFGGDMKVYGDKQEVLKTLRYSLESVKQVATDYLTFDIAGNTLYIAKTLVTAFSYQKPDGTEVSEPVPMASATVDWTTGKDTEGHQSIEFITFDLLDCTSSAVARTDGNGVINGGVTIDIGAEFNSNTYYITGDTYARNYQSGQDEFLQFIIPKGKVSAEDVSLTMEADGDPATFSMTVQCLKSESGSMVKLVKYNIGAGGADAIGNKGVASVLDAYNESSKNERDAYTSDASIITEGSENETSVVGTLGN